ncbi:hypothetical protein XA68_16259 [Ophiocordyceps unilateralis]|uniref:Carrier domain-containing protein n=1 Tax=Ophiocordyceps unilateralis TaxID=268505 RepID=A0A2A9P6X2_OPHUN|nr:hypothetical protein XA68_16259 [Ophiocordyceps unilateralis]
MSTPFHEGRIYRTGDLARFLTPQNLSLVGRADGQVKFRGHRIEVGDVEAAILAHELVSAVVVVSGQGRLVAYRDRAAGTGAAAGSSLDGAIRSAPMPAPSGPKPRNELERAIAAIWASVLDHERVGLDDNFFHIGGGSARVVRVQHSSKACSADPVASPELYGHYTVRSLAVHLAGDGEPARDSTHVRGGTGSDEIAVVSMACRLPGGIATPEAFWHLLQDGGDVITEVSNVLSGHTDAALRQQAAKLCLHLLGAGRSDSLGDVGYSLATSRTHFRHRLVLMASDKDDLVRKLTDAPGRAPTVGHDEKPRLAMLFPGQGSQRAGMGRDLARYSPAFREALHESEPGSEAAGLLQRTEYAQPALFALSVALWRMWSSWGVRPDLVLGHSAGELAAAHAAGVMDLADACRLVAARGLLMQALPGDGAMVSLEASADAIEEAVEALGLASKVDVAGRNTPRHRQSSQAMPTPSSIYPAILPPKAA